MSPVPMAIDAGLVGKLRGLVDGASQLQRLVGLALLADPAEGLPDAFAIGLEVAHALSFRRRPLKHAGPGGSTRATQGR